MELKTCRTCQEPKPTTAYSHKGKGYLHSACRACRAVAANATYRAKQDQREAEGWINPRRDWFLRFLDSMPDAPDDECWEWLGTRLDEDGYGVIGLLGGHMRAHRLSFALHYGDLPAEAFICHRCDNPPCINPRHLYAGDVVTNSRDAVERGRLVVRIGEEAGSARLTETQVRELRVAYATGRYTQYELARHYGIAQSQVSNITRRAHWGHVA